jgi:hypothetical protein
LGTEAGSAFHGLDPDTDSDSDPDGSSFRLFSEQSQPGKGCALDIPLKNSGIRKPEVGSQKPEWLLPWLSADFFHQDYDGIDLTITKSGCEILASGSWLLASNANEILVKLRITV